LFFGLCFIQHFADGPSHIHATTELVEAVGDVADALGLALVTIKAPDVEQRHSGIEQARADALGSAPNFGDAPNVATLGIQVVVRDKQIDVLPTVRSGRGDGWRA